MGGAPEWPWHMRTLDLTRREFERNPGVRTGLAVALPGGRGAVTHDPGDDEHFILLLSANGDVVERWRDLEARAKVASLAVSDDGRLAAIGREDGAVTLWELPSQRAIARWHDHQTRVISIAFSPDGAKVATVVSSGHLVIRALLEWDPLLVWRSETETLLAAAFADDDTPCTSGSAGLRWWRWDPVRLTEALDRVHLDPTPEQQRRLQVLLRRK